MRSVVLRLTLSVGMLAAISDGAKGVVPAQLIVKVGDIHGGRTVSALNSPFTDGNGKVGFVSSFSDNTRGVWHSSGFVFNSSDLLPDSATGGEGTMGVSNTGGFIYSPSFNGEDAVVTHGGNLLSGGQAIMSLPGRFSTFSSRPRMLPDGTAYWIGGSSATSGGSSSNRHLLKATDPTDPMSITAVISGGDVIDGKTVETGSSNFDFEISDNGLNHIHILDMATGSSANDIHVYRNGSLILQEGTAVGDGTNWEGMDIVAINNLGDWILTGDTTGATTTDEFVAFKGEIKVREGDTLDGTTIASGASLRAASINNLGGVVHMWGWGSGASAQEHLFYGLGDTLQNSIRLLSLGDILDTNNDTIGDWLITDLEASATIGPGLDLADDGFVHLEVSMTPVGGGDEVEAIIRLGVPEPGSLSLLALGVLAIARRRGR